MEKNYVLFPSELHRLNTNEEEYAFAMDYAKAVSNEVVKYQGAELDATDIMLAVLNGIKYGKEHGNEK